MTVSPTQTQERVRRRIALLEEACEGHFDNLECPDCLKPGASVWVTDPSPGEYRTWLLCAFCDFHSHVINSGKPTYFTEDRRRADLEERDRAILKQIISKKPQE